jgi:hypothetical protein
MKLIITYILPVAVLAQLAGCADDDPPGPAAMMDARAEVLGDAAAETWLPDAPDDVPDALVSDTQPDQEVRPGVDCAAIGCGDALSFRVPGFIARFGAEARLIDVTVCRGTSCEDARVQLQENGGVNITQADGGPASVGASLLSDTLRVSFRPAAPPTTVMPRQEQVDLRIVTSTGRSLVSFRTQAPVEVFCPGGLACGICEAITVDLDTADGGQPVDANDHPGRGGVCQ